MLDSLYKINTQPHRYDSGRTPNIYDYDSLVNLCNKLIKSYDEDIEDKLATDSIGRYYQSDLPRALMDLQNKQGGDNVNFFPFPHRDEEEEEINDIMKSFLKIVNDVAVNYLRN